MADKKPEISIILPCLNEEKAIGNCIDKIKEVTAKNSLDAEIIVVDNGSTDASRKIASEKGAKLIEEKEKGYGAAYLKGLETALGEYFFLADSDGTYDFIEIPRFIAELKKGYDLVIGDRFKGKMEKGAMPWPNRYIGNPILSGILRLFFKAKIHDAHCGMRAITRKALQKITLRTMGMEFASEMIVQAVKKKLKIKELPINYHKRAGDSKLEAIADGWRHMRFMLLYSPLYLFFIPGVAIFLFGVALMLWLYFGSPEILKIRLQYHPMFPSALLTIIGYQLIIFALFAKTYAITHLGDKPILDKLYKYITIENAGLAGIIMGVFGLLIYVAVLFKWLKTGFGELQEVKNSILALTLITIGIQTIFSSFMLSILGIKEK